jgi:arabinan endo-1,5-alpha-L-arabinosidase
MRRTYINPLLAVDTPDPFVLKHLGVYWCYCTGSASTSQRFPVLSSQDLLTWNTHGGAMHPLEEEYSEYWAPEVRFWRGKFYLYYSTGDGSKMHLRVAVADQPDGPFTDSGRQLTSDEFAIDPHVFEDDDGQCWLFYATDFLEHTHIGTGTVRDRMIDPFTLAGKPSPVVRAKYSWQLFDPERKEKGGVRWHTVEGPTVLKHKGLYYLMFSGGNWKNSSYGVGYAVSATIHSDQEWEQLCDGTRVLPLLRTVPGVMGPGHNSVVRGPDNRQLYCVYHRWDAEIRGRVLSIDPLEWIGDELSVFGPTTVPQPAPNLARTGLPGCWNVVSGNWSFRHAYCLQHSASGYSEVRHAVEVRTGFVVECNVKAFQHSGGGSLGLIVSDIRGTQLWALLSGSGFYLSHQPEWDHSTNCSTDSGTAILPLESFHLIRLEASGFILKVSTANSVMRHKATLQQRPLFIGLFTNALAGEFRGFSVTRGWQDTFEDPDEGLAELAFEAESGAWAILSMALHHHASFESGAIFKLVSGDAYEFVVNVRREQGSKGCYGFFPASPSDGRGPLVAVVQRAEGWELCLDRSGRGELTGSDVLASLPFEFDIDQYQQFGFTLTNGIMAIRWRGTPLCEVAADSPGRRVGLFAQGRASFDMVRVTELRFN